MMCDVMLYIPSQNNSGFLLGNRLCQVLTFEMVTIDDRIGLDNINNSQIVCISLSL